MIYNLNSHAILKSKNSSLSEFVFVSLFSSFYQNEDVFTYVLSMVMTFLIKSFYFSSLLREGIESNPGPSITRIVIADQVDMTPTCISIDIDTLVMPEQGMINHSFFNFNDFTLLFLYDGDTFQVVIAKVSYNFDLSSVDDGIFLNKNFTVLEIGNYKEFTASLHDITGLKLMFDIELNPGPEISFNNYELIALYLDCINLTALSSELFQFYHPDCQTRFNLLKLKYLSVDTIGVNLIFDQMEEYLFCKPQMLASFNPLNYLANPINNLADSVKNAKIDVSLSTETLNSLMGIATKVSEVNVGINTATREFLTPGVPDILNLTNVFLWLQSPKNQICTLSVILVILLLTRRSFPSCSQLLVLCAAFGTIAAVTVGSPTIVKVVSGWFNPTPQAGDDDWLSICGEILSFGFFSRSVSFSSTENFLNSFAKIEKQSKSFSDYVDRLKSLITKLIRKLAETFGFELSLGFDKHALSIRSFTKRLMVLKQDPILFNGNVTFRFCSDVKALDNDINNYLIRIEAVKDNTSYSIALQNLLRLMQPLLAIIRNSYIRRVVREVPFNINLVGPSGVGKTQITSLIIASMFAEFASDDQKARADGNFFNMCYALGLGDKFCDTYNNNFAFIFNDFLQRLEVEGMSPSDVLLFIQMLGNSPTPLNCAELSKKGLVMFVSEFIVTSMNMYTVTKHQCKVLTHVEALTRRLNDHMNILMTVKPEFQIKNCQPPGVVFPENDSKFWAGLNRSEAMATDCEHGINTSVYQFDEWDSSTGSYKVNGFRNLSYEDMMKIMSFRFNKHRDHQKAINDKTAKYMSKILDKPEAIPALLEVAASNEPFVPFTMQSGVSTQMHNEEYLVNDYIEHYPKIDGDCIQASFVNDSIMSEINELISHDNLFRENENTSILLDLEPDLGLCAWISRYISSCFKYGYRLTIGGEYGFYKTADNFFNKILMKSDWCDLFYIADAGVNLTDNVVYYSLLFRDRFCDMMTSLYNISCSLISRISAEVVVFRDDPLLWLRNNPYLAVFGVIGAATAATVIYKGFGFLLDSIFKVFSVNPEMSINEEVLIINPDVAVQSDKREDHNLCYMRGPLRNFMRVFLRSRVADSTEYYYNYPSRAVGICGREVLMPYHLDNYIRSSQLRPSISTIEIGFVSLTSSSKDPAEWYFYDKLVKDFRYKDRDLMFVTLPPHVNEFSDIRSYFPKDTPEFRKLIETYGDLSASMWLTRHGVTSRERTTLQHLKSFTYTIANDLMDPSTGKYFGVSKETSTLSYPMRVSFPTAAGDCCTATFIDDNILKTLTSTDSSLQNPVLGYIHLAGHSSLGIGYGDLIFREMFSHFRYGNNIKPIINQINDEFNMRSNVFKDIVGTQSTVTEFLQPVVSQPEGFAEHHEVIGIVPPVAINNSSKITRSPFYSDVKREFGITKYPVQLYETTTVKPMESAREHYGSNVNFSIDHVRAYLVAEEVVSEIFSNSSEPKSNRVYTTKEALEGIPAENVRSNDRSKSWGYPMKVLCKAHGLSSNDMRWAFGRGDRYEYDSPLAKIVLELCDKADVALRSGEEILSLYMDCVKDELKEENKARLFCANDKIFLLEGKKFFGSFGSWIHSNRVRNGVAIGINPYADWDTLFRWLTEVGEYGVAGDYKKYDKKQVQLLMFVTKMCIDRFYSQASVEDNRARDVLWNSFSHSFHVALSKGISYVYEWFHANTSGNFLTGIINSIGGLFIVKYSACDLITKPYGGVIKCSVKQLDAAFKLCRSGLRVQTYGDDNIIMIAKYLQGVIDFYSLQEAISRNFNLDYTDEQKGKRLDYVIPPHSHITLLSLIARGFRHQGRIVVGPLRDVSVFETLAWYKNTRDEKELLLRVERSLKELSPRGPEEFYLKSKPIIDMCVLRLKKPPKFQLWDSAFAAYCAEEVLSFDCGYVCGSLDIADFNFLSPDADESD